MGGLGGAQDAGGGKLYTTEMEFPINFGLVGSKSPPPPTSSKSTSSSVAHEPTNQPTNLASIYSRCRHSFFLFLPLCDSRSRYVCMRKREREMEKANREGKRRNAEGTGSGRRGKSRHRNEKLRDTQGRGYVRRVQSGRVAEPPRFRDFALRTTF